MEIVQIGNFMKGISAWDNPSVGRVYDQNFLAPTLNSGGVVEGNHTSLLRKKMNEEKQIIVIGKMKSCKNGFHTGDEVFDRGGLVQNYIGIRP